MNVELVGFSPFSLKNVGFHSHHYWEIVLNLEGAGTTVIGEKELPFYPGSIICQPPNVPHSKASGNRFKDIYIQASDFLIQTNGDILFFDDDEEKSFEALMFLSLRTFHKKDANYIPIVNALYESMQQILLSWSGNKPRNESVELFKNELINNFMNPEFHISDAVEKTAYCTDYFRRCFKKETGTTPIAYLIELRIEYAKKLLVQKSDSRISIAEIAYLSGFYDQHYFSRLFKSKVGCTPQDFVMKYNLYHSKKTVEDNANLLK